MSTITCQDVVELVTSYLEGTMGTDDRRLFQEHLKVCPGCDRYLRQMERTIALVGEVREESLAPATRQRLIEAFADWKRSGREPRT
jgi:predicted anti-sigma-YlaC factor YlaD